ncbi:MAG: DUF2339 domain-containing protein, partial [Cyclobacteriaceae bacterium]|nr:DUF2339 domain-containing protein [Cyclobacteriaceae bacterium]
FAFLSVFNIYKIKNTQLGIINLGLNALVLGIFLVQGLYVLSDLREVYISQFQGEYFDIGIYNLVIRYISIAFAVVLLVASYYYVNQKFIKQNLTKVFGISLHISILWILSSELIHWLDMTGSTESYKLGLSILWGSYSLMMIVLGIWKNLKFLRIIAIIIFALTLVKLFFYDVSHLGTIQKTILFVSLGILLLIISFLYNKYKNIISDEE